MRRIALAISLLFSWFLLEAQESGFVQHVSMQGSFSQGKTPLWLNANKYGLSSLTSANGYLGYGAEYTHQQRNFQLVSGIDIYLPMGYRMQGYQQHYTSHVILQQAYIDLNYRNIYLSVGAKQRGVSLKNIWLSSGSQTFGINARPVPQVRLGTLDYWVIPHTGQWIALKGHFALGLMTDGEWESVFAAGSREKYNRNTRYHEKAGYMRIGNKQHPWNLVLGLEMAAQFGGTLYNWRGTDQSDVKKPKIELSSNLTSYQNAIFCTASTDYGETIFKNTEGDILGSWVARFEWNTTQWKAGLYYDHYFEDHSSMGFCDYDGYGTGSEWDERKRNNWFAYKPTDGLFGVDLELKQAQWVKNITLEYLNATYQSGPIYHDHNQTWSDHVCGIDEYYNHSRMPGWQHWGQLIGNPLYRSPQYNTDGYIGTSANRVIAWHAGVSGNLHPMIAWRGLLSYQKSWGRYIKPFVYPQENTSLLLEVTSMVVPQMLMPALDLPDWLCQPFMFTLSYGQDWGKLLGDNCGLQATIKYTIR